MILPRRCRQLLWSFANHEDQDCFELCMSRIDMLAVCSAGIQSLLDIARHFSARFMQAPTSKVYGDPDCDEQDEDYRRHPSAYAEALVAAHRHEQKTDAVITRIF